jgi:hypothetical protein
MSRFASLLPLLMALPLCAVAGPCTIEWSKLTIARSGGAMSVTLGRASIFTEAPPPATVVWTAATVTGSPRDSPIRPPENAFTATPVAPEMNELSIVSDTGLPPESTCTAVPEEL